MQRGVVLRYIHFLWKRTVHVTISDFTMDLRDKAKVFQVAFVLQVEQNVTGGRQEAGATLHMNNPPICARNCTHCASGSSDHHQGSCWNWSGRPFLHCWSISRVSVANFLSLTQNLRFVCCLFVVAWHLNQSLQCKGTVELSWWHLYKWQTSIKLLVKKKKYASLY